MRPGKSLTPAIRLSPYLRMVALMVWMLFLYMATRMLLYGFSPGLFGNQSAGQIFYLLWVGLRFDLSALLYINGTFILIYLILLFIRDTDKLKKWNFILLFCLPNAAAMIANLVDSVYYRFTFKRLTADFFDYLNHAGDLGALLPQFAKDFWYIGALMFVFIFAMIAVGRRILINVPSVEKAFIPIVVHSALSIILLFFTVIGMRGGFQLKPISPAQASLYVDSYRSALVLNSPFTILKSIGKIRLEPVLFFSNEKEMKGIFNPRKQYSAEPSDPIHIIKAGLPARPNIVLIMLESFSTEHIGALARHINDPSYTGYTPFLDSLIRHSFVFDGYANGKRSIEAVPCALSSLPSLMNNDFISSIYTSNHIESIASLVKTLGYNTSFIHGGTNGTMGFETYSKNAGFDTYIGRSEFGDDSFFDGKWGIFDEPFLQFTASYFDQSSQPFFSFVFTLSSHHPYKVPVKYIDLLKKGPLPIHQAIAYADLSLKKFFDTASAMPWFKNTLFVITADHTSEPFFEYYTSYAGSLSIPMIFYRAGIEQPVRIDRIVQQADIMPTLLHIAGYEKPFISFGSSAFGNVEEAFNMTFSNNRYQLIKDGYLYHFLDGKGNGLFELQNDPLCTHNLIGQKLAVEGKMEWFVKSLIQQYNDRLIHNSLTRTDQ